MDDASQGREPQPNPGLQTARPDTTTMTDRQLARAVVDRTLRPRVGEVRRLAEAVLAADRPRKGKKTKADKPGRKLAKIPGQKKKKKA